MSQHPPAFIRRALRRIPPVALGLGGPLLGALGCGFVGVDPLPTDTENVESGGASGVGAERENESPDSDDGERPRRRPGTDDVRSDDDEGGTAMGGTSNLAGSSGMDDGDGSASGGATSGADAPCSEGRWLAPEMISTLGLSGKKTGPSVTADGLVLYFAFKEGPSQKIYRALRPDRATPFGSAKRVEELDVSGGEGAPFITPEHRSIYFYSSTTAGPANRDLFRADWTELTGEFGIVEEMSAFHTEGQDATAWVSADHLTMYVASARETGKVKTDLWVASRTSEEVGFGSPEPVAELNSSINELSPSLSADARVIYFTSDRGDEGDDYDVWMASRDSVSSEFSPPVRVDELSSSASELHLNLSPDGYEMFMSSERSGSYEIWVARRDCSELAD